MPDEVEPPAPPRPGTGAEAPRGPARYAWFAGLLEGRRGGDEELRRIVTAINALGLARVDLELDGGRFSALLDERTVAGEVLTQAALDELVRLLGELTRASAEPATVESTMRCTAVHHDAAVETLFAPLRGELQCASRVRAVEPGDLERAPGFRAASAGSGLTRRRSALIGLLMVVAFSLLVWQSGLLDRFTSTAAEQLELRHGPFGDLLAAELEGVWGNYRVVVRRGGGYPDTADDVTRLEAAARSAADRAAVRAVCDGDSIYVRLQGEGGEILVFVRAELRALLARADAEVAIHLPGSNAARSVELALEPGPAPK